MKRIKTIQSLILCAFSFYSLIHAEIDQPQDVRLTASEQAEIIKIIQFADKALIKSFSSLQKIENTLTEIALLVRKGSFKCPVTKLHEIMELLTENKMTVNALLHSQAELLELKDPQTQLEYTFLLTEFCNAFIPYLNEQIKNNFQDAKPFNIKHFILTINKSKTRSKGQHLNPRSLRRGLKQTRIELISLNHNVKNIGLTWYNKAARSIDKNIVAPANKYHIPTIAYYGGCATLFSIYSLWYFGHLLKDNKHTDPRLTQFINDLHKDSGPIEDHLSGPTLITAHTSSQQEDTNPFGSPHHKDTAIPTAASKFAVADYMINKLMSNNKPLASLAAMHLYTSFSETWKDTIYPKLMQKKNDTWNFLRGGEYCNTQRAGLHQIKPTYTFKDMVGLDEVKEAFSQIIQYIDDPEQLMRIEATPEKGWLLTGPSRTGKSFSIECLCGEIELMMKKRGKADTIKFFNIDAFLVNKFGIKDILEQVSMNAPAVIFIDEIDLLGLQRVGNNALLSEFLQAMQSSMNADPSKVVIVIAATNNPQNIDKALRQNGRFGKEIRFEAPARKYRIQYIKRELANMALDLSQFDLESLADKTNQKTFEDLKAIIRSAMTRAWLHRESLNQTLLENSIDTEIHHIITAERKDLPEHEMRIVATHFAGRALATMHLETHVQLDKVTIHARMTDLKEEGVWENYDKKDEKDQQQKIEYGFLATKQSHDSINVKKEITIINEAITLIAGFAAEELLLGSCGFTCHKQNHDRAFQMINDLVFGGLKPEALPKKVNQALKLKAYNLLKQCHEDAIKLLLNHKDALTALVDELMDKKIMTDKQVQAIVDKAEGRTVETTPSEETSSFAEASQEKLADNVSSDESIEITA